MAALSGSRMVRRRTHRPQRRRPSLHADWATVPPVSNLGAPRSAGMLKGASKLHLAQSTSGAGDRSSALLSEADDPGLRTRRRIAGSCPNEWDESRGSPAFRPACRRRAPKHLRPANICRADCCGVAPWRAGALRNAGYLRRRQTCCAAARRSIWSSARTGRFRRPERPRPADRRKAPSHDRAPFPASPLAECW